MSLTILRHQLFSLELTTQGSEIENQKKSAKIVNLWSVVYHNKENKIHLGY